MRQPANFLTFGKIQPLDSNLDSLLYWFFLFEIAFSCGMPIARAVHSQLWTGYGFTEVFCEMKVDNSRVMTVKELSDYLKVHPSTVYRQLKRGQLPAFKVGSDWRFNVESIDRWRLEQDSFGNETR